jgi:predicted Zn-dependent protease
VPGSHRGPAHAGRALEALLDEGGAVRARWILEQRLTETPDDHALWAALSFTWFEEGRLDASLDAADRAQAAAPGCGLVQWYRANLLAALGREAPARALFRALEEAGEALLSSGNCALEADQARQMVQRAEVWLTLDARGARRMPEPQLRLGPEAGPKTSPH